MWLLSVSVFVLFSLAIGDDSQDRTVIYYDPANPGDERDIFDVTTIFDVTKPDENGSLHLRTNALGLPLYDGKDFVPRRNLQDSLTCDMEERVCNWDTKGWNLSTTYITKNVVIERVYKAALIMSFKFNSEVLKDNDKYSVIFTPDNSTLIPNEDFVVIQFTKESTMMIGKLYRRCSLVEHKIRFYFLKIEYSDGTHVKVSCEYCNYLPTIKRDESVLLGIVEGCCGKHLFRVKHSKVSNMLSEYSSSSAIKYFFITGPKVNRFKLLSHMPATTYSSEVNNSEMVSPAVELGQRVCLVIEYHSPYNSTSDKDVPRENCSIALDVWAEDLSGNRHHLKSIYNVKTGWNVKRLDLMLPDQVHRPKHLILKKPHPFLINIIRISACSLNGEVETLQENFSNIVNRSLDTNLTVAAHTVLPAEIDYKEDNKCLNGGVLTEKGCACPPGFNGTECRSGCGRNNYGHDCGGRCSLQGRECEGFLLCTVYSGCHCAPGYYGRRCNKKCLEGWYGNDCSQRCGHCHKDSTGQNHCDIYTGECLKGCKPGYIPPYC